STRQIRSANRPPGAINQRSLAAILRLMARFKGVRESQGLTLSEVGERMGIDAPALAGWETGKMLNPTLATLHKWAEALGQKLDLDLPGEASECADLQKADSAPEIRARTLAKPAGYEVLGTYLRMRRERLQSCQVLIEDKLS